jgi:hypothetical protein
MASLPKPDEGYIRDYREHLRGVWSKTHAHWHGDIDPWYWQYKKIWPDGSQRSTYIPSTARHIVDDAADTQMAFEPKFTRKPMGETRQHEMDADQIESGLRSVFVDAMLHEPVLAFKQIGKYLGMYGYGVIEGPILELENRPEEPKKRRGETEQEFGWRMVDYKNAKRSWNPIRIRSPHPRQVLIDPTVKRPIEAVKYNRLYVSHIEGLLDSLRERDRKPEFIIAKQSVPYTTLNPFLPVEVTEYWSSDYHAMTAGDTLLFVERNLYGFVPYNHAFTGFGGERTENATNDPVYMSQGLLDGVLDALLTEAQGMSAKHNAIIERSYLRTRVSRTADPAEIADQLDVEDGILSLDEDEIGFVRYPDLERALFQIGGEVRDDIEAGTFSRSIAGMRQQGVSTVGQQAILSTAATRKFASVNKHLNLMATVVGQNILKLVDRLGEAIEVGSAILEPKLIHSDYNITAEFQTLDPILQLQEREVGMREVSMGLKSQESYRENDLRVADESLEFKRLVKEKVRQTPEYFTVIAREVAKEDGLLEMVENLQGGAEAGGTGGGVPQPEISDQAGGGAPRALGEALTPNTAQPPVPPLPPNVAV